MNVYSWRQRIKYQLKAKSRHGVHSPFAYDFIEQVLLRPPQKETTFILPEGLNKKQQSLLQSIVAHYPIGKLEGVHQCIVPDKAGEGVLYLAQSPDSLPEQYAENDIVVILGIYQSAERTKIWQDLLEYKSVLLSIDVFEMGILFFREDFKVKQHFILKYR